MIRAVVRRLTPSEFDKLSPQDHFAEAYHCFRVILGVIGIAIPIVLWALSLGDSNGSWPSCNRKSKSFASVIRCERSSLLAFSSPR